MQRPTNGDPVSYLTPRACLCLVISGCQEDQLSTQHRSSSMTRQILQHEQSISAEVRHSWHNAVSNGKLATVEHLRGLRTPAPVVQPERRSRDCPANERPSAPAGSAKDGAHAACSRAPPRARCGQGCGRGYQATRRPVRLFAARHLASWPRLRVIRSVFQAWRGSCDGSLWFDDTLNSGLFRHRCGGPSFLTRSGAPDRSAQAGRRE